MDFLAKKLHPHHVSFGPHHTSIQTLYQHKEDPYYALDHHTSTKGISVPKFDVRESSDAFYLEGEVPGLRYMNEVTAEFLEEKTLILKGAVGSEVFGGEVKVEADAKIEGEEIGESSAMAAAKPSEKISIQIPNEKELKWRLRERHVGKFERSFTFPCKIRSKEMKSNLEAGVLTIMLLKDKEGQAVEDAERLIHVGEESVVG